MIEPWVNPRSEFFWFRRRVPAKYRGFGMPAEIKFSLKTKDRDEALLLCNEHNLRLEREWRSTVVGRPADELSHRQIVALAGAFYSETVGTHADQPGALLQWRQELAKIGRSKGFRGALARSAYWGEARAFLQRKSIHLVGERLENFIRAYVEAKERASQTLAGAAIGQYATVDQPPYYYPKLELPNPPQQFETLWAEFCEARKISPATRKKWRPYFEEIIRRVGTEDMSRVTELHLLEWRDALLKRVPSAITVRDGYIAAAKSFFGWSKRMRKIPTNPAVEVHVDIGGKHGRDMRGFTDREAAIILSAALAPMGELMTAENAAARKWVPWLCAYTGARVNELTQLRRSDVKTIEGVPCILITPEAGTVKTVKERTVPLHPHLIEMGFLEWARRLKGKAPLFYSLARQRNPDRKTRTSASVGNKLAEWVRSLGIKDKNVAPNHGWRHRFKTAGRKAKMDPEVRDAIQGHKPRTEGEEYGEFPPGVMLREIKKLPRYRVTAGERSDRRRGGQRRVDLAASTRETT
ncbi:site-specific integrase [Bradyrhizobium sp. CSS354]|uniref:site-specific integrase n=1 Tax=Bradyrhizobium sp. CSS354 TaxID=2699172 RepID=UPI003182F8B1